MRPFRQLFYQRQPAVMLLAGALGLTAVSGGVWLARLKADRLVPLQSLATNPAVQAEFCAPNLGFEAGEGGSITLRSASISNGNLLLSGRFFRVPGEPWGSVGRFFERNFIRHNKF